MQQKINPITHPFDSHITLPGSKSMTNRALLLAALANGETLLQNVLKSDDSLAFIAALKALGIQTQYNSDKATCLVKGCGGKFPNTSVRIDCRDAGTVLRFLTAACANSPGSYFIDGSQRLKERPIAPLIKVLTQQGINTTQSHLPLTLNSTQKLQGGLIHIDGDISSQFLSALLMVAPLMQTNTEITTSKLISKPYIHMTCEMMKSFGIDIYSDENLQRFKIQTPQSYRAQNYTIEPDTSSASYFFAAAALCQSKITIKHIDRKKSLQGDTAFLDVLEKMGCIVSQTNDGVSVQGPKQLQGIDVDMGDISDTFMTLAAIAPFANSPTRITNIANTRLKESDRIAMMTKNLKTLGIDVDDGPDWISIQPSQPHAGIIDSANDHRIAMACSLVGLKTPGVIIDGAQCVGKTLPEFFELLGRVSG
ncbi:MAG: 3-phosphoshikimate 1-carboxyvinyltransferase [Gammaproteobacteria bacterium]